MSWYRFRRAEFIATGNGTMVYEGDEEETYYAYVNPDSGVVEIAKALEGKRDELHAVVTTHISNTRIEWSDDKTHTGGYPLVFGLPELPL